MVRAWYMDNSDVDQREPHRPADASDVTLESLAKIGVLYWKVWEGPAAPSATEKGFRIGVLNTTSFDLCPGIKICN